jgi:hypothetical protein
MGTIFRRASDVAVWLGDDQNIIEKALQFSHAGGSRTPDGETHLSSHPVFKELLSQPYWKRVWIIQEVAVASHLSVYCGDHKIGWDQFVDIMCQFGRGTRLSPLRTNQKRLYPDSLPYSSFEMIR